jgi:hypothetical protein
MTPPSPVHASDSEDTYIWKRCTKIRWEALAWWVVNRWRDHVRYKKALFWVSGFRLLKGLPDIVADHVARNL